MKEIKCKQISPQMGEVKILMRVIGKVIYLKTNNELYSESMLKNLSSKGAIIIKSRGWLKISIFKQSLEIAKLGNYEFNFEVDSEEDIEEKISNFFKEKYIEAGFTLE